MARKYISVADTAKLVREVLKRDFGSVKFSVRSKSYSGGASIDIHWTDGPTAHQVSDVVSRFEGATFDGMIDLKSYHDSVNAQGETVHYGADFIFEDRSKSREFTLKVAALVADFWGEPVPVMNDHDWFDHGPTIGPVKNNSTYETIIDLIRTALHYIAYDGQTMTFPRTSNHLPQWLELFEDKVNPEAFNARCGALLAQMTYEWQRAIVFNNDFHELDELKYRGLIVERNSGSVYEYRLIPPDHIEADGTHESMIENQRGIKAGEDWLIFTPPTPEPFEVVRIDLNRAEVADALNALPKYRALSEDAPEQLVPGQWYIVAGEGPMCYRKPCGKNHELSSPAHGTYWAAPEHIIAAVTDEYVKQHRIYAESVRSNNPQHGAWLDWIESETGRASYRKLR